MPDTKAISYLVSDTGLLDLSVFIGHEWEVLAYNLGLRRDQVAAIAAVNRNDHKKKAFQMLKIWRDSDRNNQVAGCIRAMETSGRNDLAQGMKGKGLDEVLSDTALLKLSSSIGQEWELLFENLGLTHERIEALSALYSNDQNTRVFQALATWRDSMNRNLITRHKLYQGDGKQREKRFGPETLLR